MTPDEKETIAKMSKDGCTDKQIAEVVHYHMDHVRRVRKQMGIKKRRGRRKANFIQGKGK